MQTIEVVRNVVELKRRWPTLTGVVANFEKFSVPFRVLLVKSHFSVPFISFGGERGIESSAQFSDEIRERILEITIFAFAKAVARHIDATAKIFLIRIKRSNLRTF